MTDFPKIDVWGSEGPIDKTSKALGAFYAPRAEQRRIAQLVSEGLRRGTKGKAGILLIEGERDGRSLSKLLRKWSASALGSLSCADGETLPRHPGAGQWQIR